MQETSYMVLGRIKSVTGHHVRLDEFETLKMVDDTKPDKYVLFIDTVDTVSSGAARVITRRGIKVVTIARTSGGRWHYAALVTAWRDEPVPVRVVSDAPATLAHDREEWEQLCYRPGTGRAPRDSHARQQQY